MNEPKDNFKKSNSDQVGHSDLEKSKHDLAKVSPTFCLAKWLQSTLHFHKGTTHSCHHPPAHKIELEDIRQNPSGLHNTKQKQEERQQMLLGRQPTPCEYCWNIENANASAVSDRITKSSSDWAFPYQGEVIASKLGERINPRYLEVSFSNICNFRCSYCSADYSTKWQQEIDQLGPYSTGNGGLSSPILEEEANPYIAAFWDWWPTLKNDLHVFRITGGEPLLSKNTWKILDDLEINPAPHLQIAINSNLGVPTELIFKLIEKLKSLLLNEKVGEVRIFTSIDTIGPDAELMRSGLDTQLFFRHLNLLLSEIPTLRIVIMATYSALSIFKYTELLKVILETRKIYVSGERSQPLGISTSYLRYPEHLSVKLLTEDMVKYPIESLAFMEKHRFDQESYPAGFTENERNSMKNLIEWFQIPIEPTKKSFIQNQFVKFYSEHDARRGTNSTEQLKRIQTWL